MKALVLIAASLLLAAQAVGDSKEERAEKERCLYLSASRDESVTSTGIHVLVTARNGCSKDFSGNDTWFKLAAINVKNGGTSGTEIGHFQSSIKPGEKAGKLSVDIACDPDERYTFKHDVLAVEQSRRNRDALAWGRSVKFEEMEKPGVPRRLTAAGVKQRRFAGVKHRAARPGC